MGLHNTEKQIEIIFNENFHSLVFSSFRIVNDYAQAQDIVQNVFIKIWHDFEKVKGIDDLKPYLQKAVRNSSLNYLRDNKSTESKTGTFHFVNIEDEGDNEQEIDKEKLLREIHYAVDKLPEKWRNAFILSKYENLKYYEIAEKMKISDKTVEKYISKALSLLRQELKHLLTIISIFFLN